MGDYYIILTDAGAALEAAAHAAGEPVVLTAFSVCDGGAAFTPDPAQTVLANEVYRGDISSLAVSADDTSVLEAQCIVPASSGGYTIRGIGIYADDTLYAVGNYPDQPKPAPDSGYAASLEILAKLAVSDTADVTLSVTDGAWLTKEQGDGLYVPLPRTVNGHALSEDINVTSQDIFSDQAIPLTEEDLNDVRTPGIYYQSISSYATAERHYPLQGSQGTLIVLRMSQPYGTAVFTQMYIAYSYGRIYMRSIMEVDGQGNISAEAWRPVDTVPDGAMIPWPPEKKLPLFFTMLAGQTFDTEQYPLLAADYPSGTLPDMRSVTPSCVYIRRLA
ncbi:phage tail protein [Enterobacter mori]|uniref:phage tail-collar fiber domain-containing protein n=1 Tax=Enterobacter mori TaxID=539813 RepID=UPI00398B7CC3